MCHFPGRVVTVVGMYINVLLLKRVTVQVPGRVDAVVGMNVMYHQWDVYKLKCVTPVPNKPYGFCGS